MVAPGDLAFRSDQKFERNAGREEILGAPEAARMLGRAARQPWDLI